MSKLTLCNRCSLDLIERAAAKRGATVTVTREPALTVMGGWYAVQCSDEDEPGAYFLELTDACAC